MADRTSPKWPALFPFAQELERWLKDSPSLAINAHQTWEEFKAPQARSEAELLRELKRLPGCTVVPSPQGLTTTLLLAGVEVSSYNGLLGACHEWIARVRREALKAAQLRR